MIAKAGHYSYKQEGKKDTQAKMFPELLKEIEAKRAQWETGLKWADKTARESPGYKAALKDGCVKDGKWRIGGGPEERDRFFKEVVGAFPHCFWMDGCAAPTVRNHIIEFDVKSGAKPVARQPIPLSPFDEVRVEYHLDENCVSGKMRKIDTVKEGLPEYSTPVFIVDQDAKGTLGRMVCAYGPVNKNLAVATFPSADPQKALIEQQARVTTRWWMPSGVTPNS